MLVNHGKTLNIFPRLSRTTTKNSGLSRMWQPCKKCGVSICDIACTGFSNDMRRGNCRSGHRGSSFGKGVSVLIFRDSSMNRNQSKGVGGTVGDWEGVWPDISGGSWQEIWGVESRERTDFESERKRTEWKLQVVLWFLHQTRPSSRARFHLWNWRQLDWRRRKESRRSWRAFKI